MATLLVTKWKRGDVVRLKSGGPRMTIVGGVPASLDRVAQYSVTCVWFDGRAECSACFDSEALVRVKR